MHTHCICLSPLLGAGGELGWGQRAGPYSLSLGQEGLCWLSRGDRGRGGIACPESWE